MARYTQVQILLDQLPLAPAPKTGWPWTVASPHLSVEVPDRQAQPKLSIVTPSYNQGQFIEETIRSVLLQGYPNLEYIIIDGGSTDGSVEIIRKYEKWLSYWISEPDRGQTDAINKGFARATGEMFAWINSDDVYCPGAIFEAVQSFLKRPRAVVVYGDSNFVDSQSSFLSRFQTKSFRPPQMFFDHFIPQPSVFIRRAALLRAGGANPALHFCMDYDLWLRLALIGRMDHVPRLWSKYRVHPTSKSSNLQALRWAETAEILKTFFTRPGIPQSWRKYDFEAIGAAHWRAAVEYIRVRDIPHASKHIEQAMLYAPKFMVSGNLAGALVGSLADVATPDTVGFIDTFFSLIPAEAGDKLKAYRLARARTEALLALNSATPDRLARQHARRALKMDARWVSNRHVLRRALR